jgi:hypothetical protein
MTLPDDLYAQALSADDPPPQLSRSEARRLAQTLEDPRHILALNHPRGYLDTLYWRRIRADSGTLPAGGGSKKALRRAGRRSSATELDRLRRHHEGAQARLAKKEGELAAIDEQLAAIEKGLGAASADRQIGTKKARATATRNRKKQLVAAQEELRALADGLPEFEPDDVGQEVLAAMAALKAALRDVQGALDSAVYRVETTFAEVKRPLLGRRGLLNERRPGRLRAVETVRKRADAAAAAYARAMPEPPEADNDCDGDEEACDAHALGLAEGDEPCSNDDRSSEVSDG